MVINSTALRRASLVLVTLGAASLVGAAGGDAKPVPGPRDDPTLQIPDSLRGLSGRLRFRSVHPAESPGVDDTLFAAIFGADALSRPALLAVRDPATTDSFHFAALLPLAARQPDGRVGLYRVGRWPGESRAPRSAAYRVPDGFIQVGEADQAVQVSTHFTLGQFLTKDQRNIWPKFLVLDERLVDKLELIVSELRLSGHRVDGLTVLSGFRTPQYNARGRNSGQAADSRHQYGDAADVVVDANGDSMMDDLNGDRRTDLKDAFALAAIVERVESRFPDLIGGLGVYRPAPGRSPFLHVDARGERFRWGFP